MKNTNNNVLEVALYWHSKGITPIPVRPKSKKAAIKWKHLQQQLPPQILVRSWFEKHPTRNLGLICGGAGHLLVLDFDVVLKYHIWRRDNPEYAQTFTVKTGRGYHVYFICKNKVPTKINIEKVDIKGNGYVLAPPSIHPEGAEYSVHVDGEILEIESLAEVFEIPEAIEPPAASLAQYEIVKGLTKPSNSTTKNDLLTYPLYTEPERGERKRPPLSIIARIKQNISILGLVNRYTDVKWSGSGYHVACCPFHNDHHPSFWIDDAKGICSCYVPQCAASQPQGKPMDVINFYAHAEGITNTEAIKQLKQMVKLKEGENYENI